MQSVREYLDSKQGKAVSIAVVALGLLAIVVSLRSFLGGSEAAAMSADRVFICAQTMKPFEHTLEFGERLPVKSPHSGANTGYRAELCYWTRDGRVKKEPTAVLLKASLGGKGPTFCPDCGRLVVGHNPRPKDGDAPPPIESEATRLAAQQRDPQ
jgi:hypothetical protein